jgi:PAS domain S-box-containing protein
VQAKLIVWPLLGWSSVAAIAVGVRLHRPEAKNAWYLVLAGVAMFIAGDDLYSFLSYVAHEDVPFPSFVDFFYLAVYPLLTVGLVLLVRKRSPGRDRGSVLDAAIITGGLGLLSWVFLIVPYFRSHDMGVLERFTSISYPLGDVALLAIAVRLAVGSGRRPLSFWLLAGSIVPLLVADGLYGYMNLAGTWYEHNPVDVGWIVFYVAWGTAALHPSMRQLSLRAKSMPRVTGRRLAVVGSAALIPPAVLFVEQWLGSVVDGVAISITGAVLFVLVLSRTAGLAREVADNHSEARFRSLINNASDAIIVVDNGGRIKYQTPSAERVLGRDAADLLDQPIGEMLEADDERQLDVLLHRRRDDDGRVAVREATVFLVTGGRRRRFAGRLRRQRARAHDARYHRTQALDAELRRSALRHTHRPQPVLFHDRVAHVEQVSSPTRESRSAVPRPRRLRRERQPRPCRGRAPRRRRAVGVDREVGVTSSPLRRRRVRRAPGGRRAPIGRRSRCRAGAGHSARTVPVGNEDVPIHVSIGIAVGSPVGHPQRACVTPIAMYVAKRNGKGRFERLLEMHEQGSADSRSPPSCKVLSKPVSSSSTTNPFSKSPPAHARGGTRALEPSAPRPRATERFHPDRRGTGR